MSFMNVITQRFLLVMKCIIGFWILFFLSKIKPALMPVNTLHHLNFLESNNEWQISEHLALELSGTKSRNSSLREKGP